MSKNIVVIVDTDELARVREAMRAALGLGLRKNYVRVLLAPLHASDAQVTRARETLRTLGHHVDADGDRAALIASADAVEIWT